jgi:hypothetical protein
MFRVTDQRDVQWCLPESDPDPKQIHAWSAGAHVWGCFGEGFRVVVTLTNVGSGPKGGLRITWPSSKNSSPDV